jgi:hypothetical protein
LVIELLVPARCFVRRPLHGLLIGVLTFSLTIDTARACWHLRRACCVPACAPAACMPIAACCDPCGSWAVPVQYVVADTAPWMHSEVGCCVADEVVAGPAIVTVAEHPVEAAIDIVAERPLELAPSTQVAVAEPPAGVESVVAPTPTPADAPAPNLGVERPAQKPEVVAATPTEPQLPELQPAPEPPSDAVKPASNDEPAFEPVPPVRDREEEPAAEPAVPQEENLFEKVERRTDSAAEPTVEPAEPAAEPAPTGGVDPAAPAGGDPGAPANDEDSPASAVEPVVPSPPSAEPAAPEADAPAADPADTAAREPLRRWIDATGSYAVVGELVAVGPDRISIRRNDGREISVPLDKLSLHDRAYARDAGERLAARRPAAATSRETAGL